MFLQKMNLDKNVTYESLASLENIIENLHIIYNHIPIITPHISKSMSKTDIENEFKKEKSSVLLSVPQYKEYKNKFDSSHIVLINYSLFESFGYSTSDLDKPFIVTEPSPYQKLPMNRFFVNATKDEKYVKLYILSQAFKGVVVTRDVDRTEMFCRIFKIDAKVLFYSEIENIKEECVFFLDNYASVDAERIFLINNINENHLTELKINSNLAGKFKYRIQDIMVKLSPRVVQNKDSFNYSLYKDITN